MEVLLNNILFIPIIAYLFHYMYSFYSSFYKTNKQTIDSDELISNFIYVKKALRR